MCILIYCPSNRTPDRAALENSAANNPDGFGWAIITDSGVDGPERYGILMDKGMDSDKIIDGFLAARAAHPSMPALFHARITTHGKTGVDNCHPFIVENGTVLAHNGMLPIKERDGKSDTHQFATEWLPHLGVADMLDTPENFVELSKFAAGNKLVILSVDPSLRYWSYIVNEHLGDWDDGIWYSNSSYSWSRTKFVTASYTPYKSGWGGHYDDRREYNAADYRPREWAWLHCDLCRDEYLWNSEDATVCPTCRWCNDCASTHCSCGMLENGAESFFFDDQRDLSDSILFADPYLVIKHGSWYIEADGFMWVFDEAQQLWREGNLAEYEAYEDLHCPIDDLVANPRNFGVDSEYPTEQITNDLALQNIND